MKVPIVYDDEITDEGFRIDMLVEEQVIVESKAVTTVNSVVHAQVLSYLKLSGHKVALLINFHVLKLRDGITRFIN